MDREVANSSLGDRICNQLADGRMRTVGELASELDLYPPSIHGITGQLIRDKRIIAVIEPGTIVPRLTIYDRNASGMVLAAYKILEKRNEVAIKNSVRLPIKEVSSCEEEEKPPLKMAPSQKPPSGQITNGQDKKQKRRRKGR